MTKILMAVFAILAVGISASAEVPTMNCAPGSEKSMECKKTNADGSELVSQVVVCIGENKIGMSVAGRINQSTGSFQSSEIQSRADIRVGATSYRAVDANGLEMTLTVKSSASRDENNKLYREATLVIPALKNKPDSLSGALTTMECFR